LEAYTPITFNTTGDYEYVDTVKYEGGFVMTGTIRVIDRGVNANPSTFDSVGVLMVPSMDVQNIAASIKSASLECL